MTRRLRIAALALLALTAPAGAQAPPGDATLLFNPDTGQWVSRAGGAARICLADGRCLPLRFERLRDDRIAGAEIAGLGFAGGGYYLSVRHAEMANGRAVAYRCANESCQLAAEVRDGEIAPIGTFAATVQGQPTLRAVFLLRQADAPDRARLMLCGERTCTEQPLTRDNPGDYAVLGQGSQAGLQRVWLRDRTGAVHACGLAEADGERMDCAPTGAVFPPAGGPETGAPASTEGDPQSLAVAIEDAIRRGNLAEAERLLAEARERFPNAPQWAQFDGRIRQMRAEGDNRIRMDRVRRLVGDARRYAQAGDYRSAEAVLQEAERLAPGAPEIAQARAEIGRLRSERYERYRERNQLAAAIDQAIANFRLWEAENLLAEALRRYPNDPQFQNYAQQVSQMRAQSEWQGRMQRAQGLVAAARNAMNNLQFAEAERLLDQAEALAMGLPEIRAARGELARIRAEADFRAGEINQLTADINAALARGQIGLAEQILAFAMRRHPGFQGWGQMRLRIDQAKVNMQAQMQPLIAGIRAAIQRRDWIEAQRLMNQLQQMDPNGQALQALRGEFAAARAIAGQQAMTLVGNARAAIARRDFNEAERLVQEAERADPQNPAVRQVRAELNAARAAPPPVNPAIQALLNNVRAAMQQRNWPEADRQLRQAEQADPNNPAVRQARAELTQQQNAAAQQVQGPIGEARAALARRDFAAAEAAVRTAERIDPFNPAVRQLRADLDAAKAAPPPVNPAIQALLTNVRAAMQQRNWPEADRVLRQAEQADPNNPAVRQARADLTQQRDAADRQAQPLIGAARAALARRDLAAAEAAVRQAEQIDPFNPAVRQVRADLDAAKGAPPPIPPQLQAVLNQVLAAAQRRDWPETDRLLRQADQIAPNHPAIAEARNGINRLRAAANQQAQGHITTARAAIARRDFAAAEAAVRQAEQADPTNPAVRQVRADLNAARGAPGPLSPQVQALLDQASQAMGRKDWPAADRALQAAEQAAPNDPQVRALRTALNLQRSTANSIAQSQIALARAHMAQRNLVEAERAVVAAEAADPQNPAVKQVRADLNAAKAGTATQPSQVQALLNQAGQAMARKDWPAAERAIQAAEQAAPNDPQVRALRANLNAQRTAANNAAQAQIAVARAHMAQRQLAEAERAVVAAEAIDPQNPAVKQVRADLNAAKAAATGPAVPQLLQSARQALVQRNWPLADRFIQQAEQREPNNPSVRAIRADWVQMRDAAARAALPILQQASAAVQRGDKAAAQRLLAQAEQIDPHGDATRVVRQRVQQMP